MGSNPTADTKFGAPLPCRRGFARVAEKEHCGRATRKDTRFSNVARACVSPHMLRVNLPSGSTPRHQVWSSFALLLKRESTRLCAHGGKGKMWASSLEARSLAATLNTWACTQMDTLGIEPRAFRMRSGCDTATPCALAVSHSDTATPHPLPKNTDVRICVCVCVCFVCLYLLCICVCIFAVAHAHARTPAQAHAQRHAHATSRCAHTWSATPFPL